MKKKFNIHKGEISFLENGLEINDHGGRSKRIYIIMGVCWIVYGILSLLRYYKTGDQFLLWSGIIIISLWIIGIIVKYFKHTDQRISYDDIEKVVIKKELLETILIAHIVMKDSKKRSVILDYNGELNFNKYALNDFKIALNEKNIKVEIK